MGYLPYSNYKILQPDDVGFDDLVEHLTKLDIDFFYEQLVKRNRSFIFEVVLGFDPDVSISANLDLSFFPTFKAVDEKMLTVDQILMARRLSRNPEKEAPKLVSYCEDNYEMSGFPEDLLYMASFHGARIKHVKKVVSFSAYRFMNDWMVKLQNARAESDSEILKKAIKALSNSVPGKLHADTSKYINTKLVTTREEFHKEVSKESFFDFVGLSPTNAICIYDGKQYICKSVISIPARVYKMSKLGLWRAKFSFCAKMALHGNYDARLLFTGT